jgi:hypothetical protein
MTVLRVCYKHGVRFDENSQALAKSYGAVAFLDKVNLGTDLIPAIKRLLCRPQAQEGCQNL